MYSIVLQRIIKYVYVFFGITRSLKHTIDSINENFFQVFKNANIEYDIFIHTYKLNFYINKRNGKHDIVDNKNIDNEEYRLLNADYIEIDDQDTIKENLNMNLYRTHKDPWNTEYNSVDNFILGSYSKYRVTCMVEESNKKYDYIIFMRPDCYYIDKFNIDYLKQVNDTSIVIPNFHSFGEYKINDRFSITNNSTYKIYGKVFSSLLSMSKQQPLHSETILGKILHDNNIKINRVNIRFSRVRFSGIKIDEF